MRSLLNHTGKIGKLILKKSSMKKKDREIASRIINGPLINAIPRCFAKSIRT